MEGRGEEVGENGDRREKKRERDAIQTVETPREKKEEARRRLAGRRRQGN